MFRHAREKDRNMTTPSGRTNTECSIFIHTQYKQDPDFLCLRGYLPCPLLQFSTNPVAYIELTQRVVNRHVVSPYFTA